MKRGSKRNGADVVPKRSRRLIAAAPGLGVLAQRVANAGGEVDLVARRGKMLAFVEVKARASIDGAASSLDT